MAKNHIISEGQPLKEIFCTECNATLGKLIASHMEWITLRRSRKTLAQCKKSGKFVGEFCAKLFISNPEMLDSLWEKEPQK